jgi:hypothetical protein
MKAFTPTIASANTSSAVRGAAATPVTPAAVGGAASGSVKIGSGNHMPKGQVAAKTPSAKSNAGMIQPTHQYGAKPINVVHSTKVS